MLKTIGSIVGLSVVLVGAIWIGYRFIVKQEKTELVQAEKKNFIPEFEYKNTAKLLIETNEQSAVIQKDEYNWFISKGGKEVKADAKKIHEIRSALQHAVVTAIVSEQTEQVEQYGLGEDEKIHLQLWVYKNVLEEEELKVDMYIGKNASLPNTVFAQHVGEENISIITLDRSVIEQDLELVE